MSNHDLNRTPLIGKEVEVVDVSGGTYKGLRGTVIGESMNVIKILDDGQEKLIPKKVCIFELSQNGRKLGRIRGEDIIGRPEKRCAEGG